MACLFLYQLIDGRYRCELIRKKGYKTVEVIVAEGPWTPPPLAPDTIVGVRVIWGEAALARQQIWEVRYDQVVALGLVDRIVAPAL